jgi:hypothetical protein
MGAFVYALKKSDFILKKFRDFVLEIFKKIFKVTIRLLL